MKQHNHVGPLLTSVFVFRWKRRRRFDCSEENFGVIGSKRKNTESIGTEQGRKEEFIVSYFSVSRPQNSTEGLERGVDPTRERIVLVKLTKRFFTVGDVQTVSAIVPHCVL